MCSDCSQGENDQQNQIFLTFYCQKNFNDANVKFAAYFLTSFCQINSQIFWCPLTLCDDSSL